MVAHVAHLLGSLHEASPYLKVDEASPYLKVVNRAGSDLNSRSLSERSRDGRDSEGASKIVEVGLVVLLDDGTA